MHGTKDNIVNVNDGEKLSKFVGDGYLYEFFKIIDGDHNDLIKNHKTKIFKKIREFLFHVSKINFNEGSNVELDSNFFKKLHQPVGDREEVYLDKENDKDNEISHMRENEVDNYKNIVIKDFIEEKIPIKNGEVHLKIEEKIEEVNKKDISIEIAKTIDNCHNNLN